MQTEINVESILIKGLSDFKQRVAENILSKGVFASGRTTESMRVDVSGDTGIMWGRENFSNIEEGVSPAEAKLKSSTLANSIYWWSMSKGIEFANESKRNSFARIVANNLEYYGSWLYRNGGRKDIYTSEVPQLIKEVSENTTNAIVQTKIIGK